VRSGALWGGLALVCALGAAAAVFLRPTDREAGRAPVFDGAQPSHAPTADAPLAAFGAREEATDSFGTGDAPRAPQPLPDAMGAASGPGRPMLRLVDERGLPWLGDGAQLALLLATEERPGLERLPLAALDDVMWMEVRVAPDGTVPLPVPPGRGVWAQLSSAEWRCAPLLLRHGEPAVAVMRRVAEVSGRILDAEGQPLAGAWLALHVGHQGDLTDRWRVETYDRRAGTKPKDPSAVVSGADGSFCLPHAPGLLAVQHHDALPALVWPAPEGGDVLLEEGFVLDGEIVAANGGPPHGVGALQVRVNEGALGEQVQRPYSKQYVVLDDAFRFRVRGLAAERAFAVLEDADHTILDSQRGIFDASGRAQLTLHYEPTATVVVRIPESHVHVARVELSRVEPPPAGRSAEKEVVLERSTDVDAWQGRVPWTGATDVVIAPRGGHTYVLARVVIEQEHEVFDLLLPASRLTVTVVAPPAEFPVRVAVSRLGGTRPHGDHVREAELTRSGEELVVEHVPAGEYLARASSVYAAAKPLSGGVIAMATATVTSDADARIVLTDDSRPFDVLVVDEQGQPCERIKVVVESETLPAGVVHSCLTDAAGWGRMRVGGPGPFSAYVYEQNPPHRVGGTLHDIRPEAGVLTVVLRDAAKVSFDVTPPEPGRSLPVRLRITSPAGITGFDHDADLEDGRMPYQIRLPLGPWDTELLDAAGVVTARQTVQIRKPVDQTVRIDG
jgi:hypothetical protein